MRLNLNKPIQYIKGVGPKRAKLLHKLGIETVGDAIYNFPRDYDNRANILSIDDLKIGEKQTFKAFIAGDAREYKVKRLTITKIPVKDACGAVELIWYNKPYIKNNFKIGEEYIINGKVSYKYGQICVDNPILERDEKNKLNTGRIVPIYSLTEGLSQNVMRSIMYNVIVENLDDICEIFDEEVLQKYKLIEIKDAIINIHFPKDEETLKDSRYRLAFQELFLLQLGLNLIKNKFQTKEKGIIFNKIDLKSFLNQLNFKLTNAQNRALNEILEDMYSNKCMNRLLQGDVGSGKTIIAAAAMYVAAKNKYQAAMMVPTEILAKQHYETLINLFKDSGINVELLTGRLSIKQKKDLLDKIKNGSIDILIGTHAIIEEDVDFKNLGFCVTDEQHRFGVRQRAILKQKGKSADVLVMTATPIPRTLALMLYGDLDISVIDELPPDRKEIATYAIYSSLRERAYKFAIEEIKKGRQVYIVCPLIEESDVINARSAEIVYDELYKGIFKNYKVGLVHGKMSPKEKDKVMDDFIIGELDILISTTVIEVGINVPNASIMIIENAERFGLAQLHQLRGRVGRSGYQSYCILIAYSNSDVTKKRLKIMTQTNDGFKIAEKDLELRGPGEFFGIRQHGLPELKIANLFEDIDILKKAQRCAEDIISRDPDLRENSFIREELVNKFKDKLDGIILN
ncbi:MAG: ATP-dependent DNA helicase RecG [Thermoanaerobacteraceae bacterium]|nr:ATP-dependent DNA helicase RecG [Thermoanaerobacteraceae bacterium]